MRRLICAMLVLTLLWTAGTAGAAETAAETESPALTRFWFSRGGYMMPQSYEVLLEEDGYMIRENEEETARPFDPELAEALVRILAERGVNAWDGFSESDSRVLDGEMFSLSLEYADGTTVEAYGSNDFPDGYYAGVDALEDLFEQGRRRHLAGTYRYEGEGFGGDFTITLNADGTYSFSTGPLSSYAGRGTWDVFYGAAYLTEDEEAGGEGRFMFGIEENALIYLDGDPDAFPGVETAEGERFVRQNDQD